MDSLLDPGHYDTVAAPPSMLLGCSTVASVAQLGARSAVAIPSLLMGHRYGVCGVRGNSWSTTVVGVEGRRDGALWPASVLCMAGGLPRQCRYGTHWCLHRSLPSRMPEHATPITMRSVSSHRSDGALPAFGKQVRRNPQDRLSSGARFCGSIERTSERRRAGLLIQLKLDGNTGEEIAESNSLTANAVRQRMKRLLAKLRRLAGSAPAAG